jgi:hypothetical protein
MKSFNIRISCESFSSQQAGKQAASAIPAPASSLSVARFPDNPDEPYPGLPSLIAR